MRRYFILVILALITLCCVTGQRKKVGLVLGGGGAKGVAHIGVLKVLEEAGIPIDYIAGTSMGAIVGGLYAIGYDAEAIDSLVRVQDWSALLSDKIQRNNLSYNARERSERYFLTLPFGLTKEERRIRGVIEGQSLQNLFSDLTVGYHDTTDFNRFRIPFACIAVDVVSGKDFVFHQGNLPLAMCASMAIPAVFTPVHLDGMVLIDGGLNNNFPVDVALSMGADIIIGVDLGTSDLKDLKAINTPSDVLGQIVALHGNEKYEENIAKTTLHLRPNLTPYSSASFNAPALQTMIQRGEWEARSHWSRLMAIKKDIFGTDSLPSSSGCYRPEYPPARRDSLSIRRIRFEGIDWRDEKWLLKISRLKENSRISITNLQESISILAGTDLYAKVTYRLLNQEPYDLVVTMQKKTSSSLNAGLRFDSDEQVAVLLNATLDLRSRYQTRLAFTGRVGKRTSSVALDYAAYSTLSRNINISYQLDYKDLDIFNHGDKMLITSYLNHLLEIGYSDMNWLGFMLNVGVRYEYYDYTSFLYQNAEQNYQVDPDGYLNYFLKARFETLDRQYFPTTGISLEGDYMLYTDNLFQYKGQAPFSSARIGVTSVLPLGRQISLLPSLYSRVLIGRNPAYPYFNAIGGEVTGRYLSQQLPFAGIQNLEIIGNAVVIGGLHLRQRIGTAHYLSLKGSFGMYHDGIMDLLKGEYLWGASFGYTYNSLIGPLGANIGYSNHTKKPQLFLNLGFYF
ncbi:patatin-like phospholipase family protein [Parabacteroides sp. Marseille-P3160]|uniref:patatin-like phospholipase family protein n=1 Tax=Parabacteroides sp. Marseille-P3160 TaxID=1917887 RepID=UPI0009BB975C|nr:patatin-like phospholipase family protein [Parabacteroides sp. Marseille-P3160]